MDYQVELDSFRGPLDLLLYLVKKNEVDLCDIPIAVIAEQFRSYLDFLEWIDVEWAGEFLVMSATLMEMKSKMLLPRNETETEETADPRVELVKQLIEYKKFKDATKILDERAEIQVARMPRSPVDKYQSVSADRQPIRPVELWDLVSAFGRLLQETSAVKPKAIVMDDTPIHIHMERILERLQQVRQIPFRELFQPPYTRGRLLGLFLALLELIKGRRITAAQPEVFGEITLSLLENQDIIPMNSEFDEPVTDSESAGGASHSTGESKAA